ncbi:MAG: LamG domain-containing protein [Chloroflexi bacterium]|nr:LamG domain-containing protein [Chloroflexota bacterium]
MQIVWNIDNLASIGGHPLRVLGHPQVVDAPTGRGLHFDGLDDGVVVPAHPLEGADRFTAEVIFRPEAGGAPEQRFLHLQEAGGEDRILFETRLTEGRTWYLDTFIQSGEASRAQLAREHQHPLDQWYHAALVYDGREMRHYVNGSLEMAHPIAVRPPGPGNTAIGVRLNEVYWFRGAICWARFTLQALEPSAFWAL